MRDDTLDKLKNLLLTAKVLYEPGDQALLIDLHVLPHAPEEKHQAAEKKAWALASILRALSSIALQESKDKKPLPPQNPLPPQKLLLQQIPYKKRCYRHLNVHLSEHAYAWLKKRAYDECRSMSWIGGRILEQFSQGMYAPTSFNTLNEGGPLCFGERRYCVAMMTSENFLRWIERAAKEAYRPRSTLAAIIIEQFSRGRYVLAEKKGAKK